MPTNFSRFPVCGGTMREGSLEIMGEHGGSPQLGDALRCYAERRGHSCCCAYTICSFVMLLCIYHLQLRHAAGSS